MTDARPGRPARLVVIGGGFAGLWAVRALRSAPVDILLERIAKRRIAHEQLIERGYLQSLNEAYAQFFHDYTAAPLLIVNAAAIDPIANNTDFEELYAAVIRVRKGRQYFNPMRHRAI